MSINIINLNIKNISFKCQNEEGNINFELVDKDKSATKYEHLVPELEKDFLYLKILPCGKVISCEGKYAKILGIKRKKILGKNIKNFKLSHNLFSDYIILMFEECLKKKECYQFSFAKQSKKEDDEHKTCSIYPCYIPDGEGDKISSIDLVIRRTKYNIKRENISKYRI